MTSRCLVHTFLKTACFFIVLAAAARHATSQTTDESTFIASVNSAMNGLVATLGKPTQPVVFGSNLVFANGAVIANAPLDSLLDYVDGLKAAGVQRVDLNPGVTSISSPGVKIKYDAVVRHIRELGMRLAINAEFATHEMKVTTFQDFQAAALQTYPQMAALYHPDHFVVIHEPTTADGRMGIRATVQDWHNFILAVTPLIKAASPHTRVGAGAYQGVSTPALSDQEAQYFQDFVNNIPVCSASTVSTGCLDFVTMDIYNDDTFPQYAQWAKMAHTAGKGVYIEETWAPAWVPYPVPPEDLTPLGYLRADMATLAPIGPLSPDFKQMNSDWLHAMALFASANGMESVTAFTTQAFFAYGTSSIDSKPTDPTYEREVVTAVRQGQLTSTGQTFLANSKQLGMKTATNISSASYATLPSVFNPNCGSADNPCNSDSAVAADEFVAAFGSDLATSSATASSTNYPTNLGGTTATLVDSANTSFALQLYFVSSGQINYLVPSAAKPGPATITITSGDGTVTTGIVLIAQVTPGLYAANANGSGPAAAIAVVVHADGSRSAQLTFTCGGGAGGCVNKPIAVGSTDKLFLELYGTGLRHLSATSDITVQINGQNLPVQYAGKQSAFPGLDQINIQVPASLAVSGQLSITAIAQDTLDNLTATSNTVTVMIQ